MTNIDAMRPSTACMCDGVVCKAIRELIDVGLVQHTVHLGDENDEFRIIGMREWIT